mgnify:CR=1 FL=1
MKDYKYPDDFEEWEELGKLLGRYLILRSPDEKKLALIHLEDNDVAIVMGRQPGGNIYGGDPFTIENLKKLRVMEDLNAFATEAYRKKNL